MLRDILFAGSRLALNSACLRVDAFAAYTSPNPLPPETITGFAADVPVPPLLVETSASVTPSTRTASTPATSGRLRDAPDSLRPCILPPFASISSWFPSLRLERPQVHPPAAGAARGPTPAGRPRSASRR